LVGKPPAFSSKPERVRAKCLEQSRQPAVEHPCILGGMYRLVAHRLELCSGLAIPHRLRRESVYPCEEVSAALMSAMQRDQSPSPATRPAAPAAQRSSRCANLTLHMRQSVSSQCNLGAIPFHSSCGRCGTGCVPQCISWKRSRESDAVQRHPTLHGGVILAPLLEPFRLISVSRDQICPDQVNHGLI